MQKDKHTQKTIVYGMLVYSAALLLTALCTTPLQEIWQGWMRILQEPAPLVTDYFVVGSVGSAFANAALVGLLCLAVLCVSGAVLSHVSLLAFFLSIGFAFFGLHIGNMWPCMLGVWLYCKIMHKPFAKRAHMAIFATALSPLVSELMYRYPLPGGQITAFCIAVGVGVLCGFGMALLTKYSAKIHLGYSMYNAALPAGILGIVAYTVLFPLLGVVKPAGIASGQSQGLIVNGFAVSTSVLMILAGVWRNGWSFKGYGRVLKCAALPYDMTKQAGMPLTLINIGVFGLCMTVYYNLIGAALNGPAIGCILCLLAVTASGATVVTMLPIILGYGLAALLLPYTPASQTMVTGICFAAAMTPISAKFGAVAGVVAGLMHGSIVSLVVRLHGGFCLYNGGFTSGIVTAVLVRVLQQLFIPLEKLRFLPRTKG